ncbi:30S ribosomal protein S20 [Enterobacteriaceae endosymbiont of Donacia bicoloricornis]|uniref:30S ribosomal protein S20 n=1 Tax=Enterobacteriaceae endosymbiont of Donacia bicoloricornis TaxID=2675772 RepID=UPI0014491E3A|nr:30S ribosomal protein S20 [Enterobacteriaceae endosymbiont of Donacia bicoloricornis]QJC37604.1 30S ribosomal protein S20 [Enterobacteriaceae endosymbiont of Donacia bicoloricornis]
MANIKSSKKRALKSEKKRKHNINYRSMLRTFIKKVNNAINEKNIELSKKNFKKMQSVIDKQVQKKLIHKNKASRYKSRIYNKIININ